MPARRLERADSSVIVSLIAHCDGRAALIGNEQIFPLVSQRSGLAAA